MPICHEKQFIFFHIPRCAGTSMEQFFDLTRVENCHGVTRSGDKTITLHHLTPHDMLTAGLVDDGIFNSYFKFTIIRDPFDRLVSDYLWQQDHDCHGEFHSLSFQAYLDKAERIIREGRYFEKIHYDHFRPMIEYCFWDGKLMVDDILLLHNLEPRLTVLSDRIGPVQMPHVNASPGSIHSLENTENRNRVYEIYGHDKQLFDSISEIDQVHIQATHEVVSTK